MFNLPLPLVLGSSSPFRKALLEKLALPFDTFSPDIDESRLTDESAEALVTRLSLAKARAVAEQFPAHLIIGSDQLAVLPDGSILGKPGNREGAISQLTRQSGSRVTFLTGLCLLNSQTGDYQLSLEPFHVHFRTLTEDEIAWYVDLEKPFNSAGSFKSEGAGITLFRKLEGDDPNILVGLPLIRLTEFLKNSE